ncbi:hypothetical protein [Rhabdochlamydiaceae symbiont of Dictyostelium giganteum]|uniref:hypothetical protein n=1 Tax=Rhabdochlamydiaceae symbiont of Dictyostelium giganteum TaxID=3342349 RepID=UPI00384B256C
MFIRNSFQFIGKSTSLFFPKRINREMITAAFSSTTNKVAEATSSKLRESTSLNFSSPISLSHENAQQIEPLIKINSNQEQNAPQEEIKSNKTADVSIPWLKPFITKEIVDSEAERKLNASFNDNWISNPNDFIQIDLEKATDDDLIDLSSLLRRQIIAPEIEGEMRKRLDNKFHETCALRYANPELDQFIAANNGRVENLDAFDMYDLAHRADIGMLDEETSQRIYDYISDYNIQLTKDMLEEEKDPRDWLSDYPEHFPKT